MVSGESPRIVYLPQFLDERGNLVVCEGDLHVPFEIKRAFWIFDVLHDAERAGHAHKKCEQLIIAIKGSFTVLTYIGEDCGYYTLSDPHEALLVPAGVFIRLCNFDRDAVCLVLCSEHYSEDDYVREV